MAQEVKPLPSMLTSLIGMPGQVLAAPPLIQFPSNVPGKAEGMVQVFVPRQPHGIIIQPMYFIFCIIKACYSILKQKDYQELCIYNASIV